MKTFQGLKKNVEISDVMRNKKVFYTTAVANKKRDMFVVLYFTGTTILFTRQWRRKQIQSGGVGWGVNPKKKRLKRKTHLCRQFTKP